MVQIKLTDLVPNKYNPREIFRGAAMEELKASMEDGGLIQPILVRPLKNGEWEVVAGMRRYYAAKDLEWDSIECHVRNLNNFEAMLLAYSENVLRENLTPIELGRMYESLSKMLKEKKSAKTKLLLFGDDFSKLNFKDKLEKVTKWSYDKVRKHILLLKLPQELQSLIELHHGDRSKGFGLTYGWELARLPQDQIKGFYDTYSPKDYSIEQYQKKVSERIVENKLEGEKKRKKLEGNLNKAQLELEKSIQRKEAFEERINGNLEQLEGDYDDVEDAIKFLDDQLKEFQSEEKLDELAKNIKYYEHQVDDLDVLLVRTDEEAISICPYCLAKIDVSIINKRREMFDNEIKTLREELKEINSTMDFNRSLIKDLEEDNDLLKDILDEIKQKEKEVETLEGEISRL